MSKVKLPTAEEREKEQEVMNARAEELSMQLGRKVHPILFVDVNTGAFVRGYLQEPSLMTKLMILDKGIMSALSTCAMQLPNLMITEESDSALYKETNNGNNDAHYLGAANFLMNLVQTSQDQMKKK